MGKYQSILAGSQAPRAERVPFERKERTADTDLCQFKLCPRGRFAVCDGEVLQQGGVTDDGGGGVAVLVRHPFAAEEREWEAQQKSGQDRGSGRARKVRDGGSALLGDVGVSGT